MTESPTVVNIAQIAAAFGLSIVEASARGFSLGVEGKTYRVFAVQVPTTTSQIAVNNASGVITQLSLGEAVNVQGGFTVSCLASEPQVAKVVFCEILGTVIQWAEG